MEVVYFVLGVVTVLLVVGVVGIVKVSTLVKKLREDLRNLERGTQDGLDDVHRRMDNEVRDLQSLLDSRLDKFESKINKQKTQVLKG
jgi:hypothetical protein